MAVALFTCIPQVLRLNLGQDNGYRCLPQCLEANGLVSTSFKPLPLPSSSSVTYPIDRAYAVCLLAESVCITTARTEDNVSEFCS